MQEAVMIDMKRQTCLSRSAWSKSRSLVNPDSFRGRCRWHQCNLLWAGVITSLIPFIQIAVALDMSSHAKLNVLIRVSEIRFLRKRSEKCAETVKYDRDLVQLARFRYRLVNTELHRDEDMAKTHVLTWNSWSRAVPRPGTPDSRQMVC